MDETKREASVFSARTPLPGEGGKKEGREGVPVGESAIIAYSGTIPDSSPNTIKQSSCNLLPSVLTVDPDPADATLS